MTSTLERTFNKNTRISIWKNTDMISFYENIPVDKLRAMAISGGFEDCCDLKLIEKKIFSAEAILDAGAGYGRCINYLLRNNFSGKITAVERSLNFCNYLQSSFGEKIEIINTDIMCVIPSMHYDVVLSMWSNISEFPQEEQLGYLKKLLFFLKPNGILIIETISHTLIPKNATFVADQSYFIASEYGNAYGYTPSLEELNKYTQDLGCSITHLPYLTSAGRQRIIHIIKKH